MMAIVFLIYFANIPFLNHLSLKMFDLNFQIRGAVPGKRDVVIVAIDQQSQEKLGRWPWTRSVMADLINRVSTFGPRAVGLDIVFSYPEERPDSILARQALKVIPKNTPGYAMMAAAEKNADTDQLLADAFQKAGNVVPGYFFFTQDEEVKALHLDNEADFDTIRRSRFPSIKYPPNGKRDYTLIRAVGVKPNIRVITDASQYTGFFNVFPDEDGAMREITNAVEFNGKFFPSLSFQLLRAWFGETQPKMEFEEYGVKGFHMGGRFIPSNEVGQTLINYYGDATAFPTVSVADILKGGAPDEQLDRALRDKVVIIGATATGIYDLRVTPFGIMPGVYLHATFIQNVIDGKVLNRAGWFLIFNAGSILALGLLLTVSMRRLKVAGGGLVALGLIIFYVYFQRYMFVNQNTVLDILYPLLAIVMVYGGIVFYKYFVESSEKKRVKKAFEFYLSPKVINKMLKDPGKLQLGGEMKELTASFSDVKDFSGISEKLTPHELVELLNEYLTEMTNVILDKDGTLDKYIGDAIVSFYGAPLEYKNHAWRACRATILCRKRLEQLQEKWGAAARPRLEARFGLNTGKMLVGNMGSSQRFDYTIMGDEVNLAARLEGINKQYGTYICASESTWRAAGGALKPSSAADNELAHQLAEIDTDAAGKLVNAEDKKRWAGSSRSKMPGFEWRELDVIRVVGRKAPVKIFELLDFKGELSREKEAWLLAYNEAYGLYTARQFGSAIGAFKEVAVMNGNDAASLKMAVRCEGFLKDPPPDDWDGVFTHTSK